MDVFRLLLFIILFSISLCSFGQCKSFTQKQCMPKLLPFIHNGQMNNIELAPGQTASFQQTFYSGQNYKALVCMENTLSGSYFEVFTVDNKLVYTNKSDLNEEWEFSVGSTQNLLFKVFIPEAENEEDNNQIEIGRAHV